MSSRIAKKPVPVPAGVEVEIRGQLISVKSQKGALEFAVHPTVLVEYEEGELLVKATNNVRTTRALAGTTRALLNNMVIGVSEGYQRALKLVGVGYRAQLKGRVLNLALGFSHPIDFIIPEAITIETPSQTEIIIRGIDKQQVGQVAANIRAYRPPEPYKGKGVRYADEEVILRETKK